MVFLIWLVGATALGSIVPRLVAPRRRSLRFSLQPIRRISPPSRRAASGYSQHLAGGERQRLPHGKRVESTQRLAQRVGQQSRSVDSSVIMVGSVDGLLFNQDPPAGATSGPDTRTTGPSEPRRSCGGGLALGAVTALGLALLASVRRRGDLAVLKALPSDAGSRHASPKRSAPSPRLSCWCRPPRGPRSRRCRGRIPGSNRRGRRPRWLLHDEQAPLRAGWRPATQ